MRDFAVAELKLPDNASYRRFADLLARRGGVERGGRARAEPAAQDPVLSCGDGCAGYRGYFERGAADSYAASCAKSTTR